MSGESHHQFVVRRSLAGDLLVSGCLMGRSCRYDGSSRGHADVLKSVSAWAEAGGEVVSVCPEELGGLGTPRPPATLSGGDGADVLAGRASVLRVDDGIDVTDAFVSGAKRAASMSPVANGAILKARSPSCGCGRTSVEGRVRSGDGVFAALLRGRGVELYDEDAPDLVTQIQSRARLSRVAGPSRSAD